MLPRQHEGQPAQITFTSDFHELPTGDLRPGRSLRINYDPSRVVSPGDPYVHGDPARPIVAHLRYRAGGAEVTAGLSSRAGIVVAPIPDPTATRRASLLHAEVVAPEDAEEVAVWFSYVSGLGEELRDDNEGRAYHFRFPLADLQLRRATVTAMAGADGGELTVELATDPAVERVEIRYRVVNHPSLAMGDVRLEPTGEADEGRPIWSTSGTTVPLDALVRFRVFYWIGGQLYKGGDFLAPEPPHEQVPPPPAELAEAARTWRW